MQHFIQPPSTLHRVKINTYLLCWTSPLTGSHGRHPVLGSLVEERVPEGEEGVARADRPPDQLHLRLVEQPRLAPLRVDVRVRPAIFNLNQMATLNPNSL